jgi:hypothetical protein
VLRLSRRRAYSKDELNVGTGKEGIGVGSDPPQIGPPSLTFLAKIW